MIPRPASSPLFPYTTLFRSIARGCARYLHALGYCVVSELPLPSGRRADLVALGGDSEIIIVEIKSSVADFRARSEEHTSELQSRRDLVCRLLLEKKNVAS